MTNNTDGHEPDASVINNTEKPLFELQVGKDGPLLVPRSFKELVAWLKNEKEYWLWVQQFQHLVNGTSKQFDGIDEIINRAAEGVQLFDMQKDDSDRYKQLIDQVLHSLKSRYENIPVPLHSSSPRSKFLLKIDDLSERIGALAIFMGIDSISSANVKINRGIFQAFVFESGITGVTEPFEESWNELRGKMEREHNTLRTHAGALEDSFKDKEDKITTLHGKQETAFNESQKERSATFDETMGNTKTEFANLKKAYETDMSTKVAVKYFREKGNRHWIAVAVIASITLVSGYCLGHFAVSEGNSILASLTYNAGEASQVLNYQKISPVKIAVEILIITLAFWSLRLLVRSMLSQIHLATDCHARATLMQTYIALQKEGQAEMEDDDRKLVLAVLFRPMSDGFIKDDGAPPGLWDLLTKAFGSK